MALKIAVATLCLSSLLCIAYGGGEQFVEGYVYCDPCRVLTETDLSHKLPKATVRLECKDRKSEKVTLTVEGVTDHEGKYKLAVTGDHSKDSCHVELVKSPDNDCADNTHNRKARVAFDTNVPEGLRAMGIGFMRTKPLLECSKRGFASLDF